MGSVWRLALVLEKIEDRGSWSRKGILGKGIYLTTSSRDRRSKSCALVTKVGSSGIIRPPWKVKGCC